MIIAIPTLNRETFAQQLTFRNLYDVVRYPVYLFTPKDRLDALLAVLPESNDPVVVPVPNTIKGIAKTRQYIIDWTNEMTEDKLVCMLDDDMDFCRRTNYKEDAKLEMISGHAKKTQAMFEMLEGWLLGGFAHVGISSRQGNNHYNVIYRDNTRMNNAYAFNASTLETLGIDFGKLPLMEDFYVTLELLTRGYPNRVLWQYCWNQRGSGRQGGCSTYRTPELQADCARKLQKLFPDFVRVVEKTSKSQWQGMTTRTDVVIAWKKALNSRSKG